MTPKPKLITDEVPISRDTARRVKSPMSMDMALAKGRSVNIKVTGEITEAIRLSALRALDHIEKLAMDAGETSPVFKYAHSQERMELWASLKDAEDYWIELIENIQPDSSLDKYYNIPYKCSFLQYRQLASFNQTYKGFLTAISRIEVHPRDRFLIGGTIRTILTRTSLNKNPSLYKLAQWTGIDRSTLYRWKEGEENVYAFKNKILLLQSLPHKPSDEPYPFSRYALEFNIDNGVVEFVGVAPGAIHDPAYQPRIRAMMAKCADFEAKLKDMSPGERNDLDWNAICALYQEFDLKEEIERLELGDRQKEFEIKQQEEAQIQGFMPLLNYSEMKMSSEKGDIWDMTIRPLSLKDKKAYGLKIDVKAFEPVIKKHSTLLIDEEAKIVDRDLVVIQLENQQTVYVLIGEYSDSNVDDGIFHLYTTRHDGNVEEYHFGGGYLLSDGSFTGKEEDYISTMEKKGGKFKIICKHKIVASRFK